jgi:hypothetical protein
LVPASNVGGNASNLGGAAGGDVDVGKLLGTGREVLVPAEPPTVTSINVSHNVGQVERLQGVGDTLAVTRGGVLAGLQVDVGDEVGKRVGLNDQGKGLVGVGLDDSGDSYAYRVSAASTPLGRSPRRSYHQ